MYICPQYSICINKQNANSDHTNDIFDYTEWIILRSYHKRTFYDHGQKLWRQLRKWTLFVSPQAM